MSSIADKQRLIDDVIRLRRAERTSPERGEIAAVRANLEEMAGATATRAVAARLLGVSQTALDRWIAGGDLPVLVTRAGRREVPLRALVELTETVRERRSRSPNDRHPLGAVLRAQKSQAERLSARALLPPNVYRRRGGAHRAAELRGLAYHRAVAQRLDEQIVGDARSRLARWRAQGRIEPRYAQQWQEILSKTPTQIGRLIGRDTQQLRDLRQSSPFAGTLSEPERRRVLAIVGEQLA